MEYNTQRQQLSIPEYGRNLEKIVEIAINTEDKDKRTQIAHLIVDIMAQLHTEARDSTEMRHKLWDHLHIISEFKLDVDCPFPIPDKEALAKSPNTLSYPKRNMRYSYYGKNVENIVKIAMELEDGEEKNATIMAIANHLKKTYLTWNRDSVDDKLIKRHLKDLSNGDFDLGEEDQLISTFELLGKPKKKVKSKRHNGGRKKN